MAGMFGVTEYSQTEVSQLTANPMGVHLSKDVTIAAAVAGDVERGMVMGQITASGKWVPLDTGASTGQEVARGILGIQETVTISEDTVLQMYFTGEYRSEDIVWPTGITAANKLTAMQQLADRGIIIK